MPHSGVNALAISGNILYAGGNFGFAGTNVSAFVAEALLPVPPTNPPVILTSDGNFGFTNGPGGFGFGFDIGGSAGQTLVVQGSTNLVNWVPLQTNVRAPRPAISAIRSGSITPTVSTASSRRNHGISE